MAARIKADDQNIQAPQSVTKLTCLSNFFNGTGLDVITNLLDPTNLLSAVEGRICSVAQTGLEQRARFGSVRPDRDGVRSRFRARFGHVLSAPQHRRQRHANRQFRLGTNSSGGLYLNGSARRPRVTEKA